MNLLFFRKLVFVVVLCFESLFSNATTYYWIGGSSVSSNWGAGGNWSLSLGGNSVGLVVSTRDDIFVFDGSNIGNVSGSVTFTLSDSPTIGQLIVRNFQASSYLLIKPNTGANRTITVNPTLVTNFILVDSNSTLKISGNSSRKMVLALGIYSEALVKGVIRTEFGTTGLGQLTGSAENLHFASSSNYIHNQNGGVLPIATWEDGSKCSITGVTTTTPTNIASQSFSNFIWNSPIQNSNASLTISTSTSIAIRDTFRVVSTGTDTLFVQNNAKTFSGQFGSIRMDGGKLVFHKSSSSNSASFIVEESLNILGGNCIIDASKAVSNCNLIVKGNLIQDNSRIDFASASFFSNISLTLRGDFLQNGNSAVLKTKGLKACQFVFGGANSTISPVSNGIKSDLSIVVFKNAISDTLTFSAGFLADSVDFTIKKGVVFLPDQNNLEVAIHALNILSEGTLKLNGQHTFTVTQDWNNSGTFMSGISNIVFRSEVEQLLNSTVKSESFYSLMLKGKGLKKLTQGTLVNILPSGTLALDSGVTFDLASQIFTLKSDSGVDFSDNTAHLAIMPDNAKIINTAHFRIERYIPQGKRTLRFLSSPVKGAHVSNWAESFYVTGQKSNYPDNALLPAKIPTVTYYNESLNGNSSQKFVEANGLNTELGIGRGYRAFIRGGRNINLSDPIPFATATTIVAEGIPNRGDITVNLTYTDHLKPLEDGWNLIGNPYPAAIDWDKLEVNDKAKFNNAFYVFDPRIGKNGGYYSYSNGVSSSFRENPSIIPSSQSFFVKLNSLGMSAIHFHENQKVTSAHKTNFRLASENLIRISVSGLDDFDETVVQFEESSTDKFDLEYDAYKLDKAGLSVFSQSLEGVNLSINRLPATDIIYIPLTIKSLLIGTYKLSLNSTFLVDEPIFLIDHFQNTKVPIENIVEYVFEVNSALESSNSNRFTIESTSLTLGSPSLKSVKNRTLYLFPNPLISDELSIFPNEGKVSHIELLDLSGRILLRHQSNKVDSNVFVIPTEIKNGAYVIKCYSETGVFTQSLIISR